MTPPKRFPDRDEIAAVREEAAVLEPERNRPRNDASPDGSWRAAGTESSSFLDLVDRSGRIQLLCDESRVGRIDVDLGDVVGVVGSPASSRRGEPSLAVDELTMLVEESKPAARHLPRGHGPGDALPQALPRPAHERGDARALPAPVAGRVGDPRLPRLGRLRRGRDPILQPRYGGAFAHPFVTHSQELDADLYLRIATELYLKRLIVGGLERVYEIGKDFRNESVSYKHQPEFTMLEWYEAYADYQDTMARIEALVEQVAHEVLGTDRVTFRGHEISLERPWRRVRFVDALEELELWTRDPDELRAWLGERGVDTKADKDWPQLVDHAFSHFVEPGLVQPTIVHDYPIELSPFARLTDGDPTLTERFEYFAGGMELGNAFTEINDAEEQSARFDAQSEHVEGERGDPDYVEALSYGMPPTGGLGLGIDRLTMLLSGRDTIRDVILFPALRSRAELTYRAPAALTPALRSLASLERDHVREDVVELRVGAHPIAAAIFAVDGISVEHVLDSEPVKTSS